MRALSERRRASARYHCRCPSSGQFAALLIADDGGEGQAVPHLSATGPFKTEPAAAAAAVMQLDGQAAAPVNGLTTSSRANGRAWQQMSGVQGVTILAPRAPRPTAFVAVRTPPPTAGMRGGGCHQGRRRRMGRLILTRCG